MSCEGCTGLTTIPDPLDCRRFYYCDGDQLLASSPFDCPDGQVFNSELHECQVDADWLNCKPACPASPPECHYTCQSGDPYIASLYDCNSYHICDADGTSGAVQSCPPEKPFFDGKVCQTDEGLCCHCHPYCFPGDEGRLVVDPVDCRKYHVCLAEGVPANSGTCNHGEHFDPISRKCSTEAPCRTMCRNVVGADGCIDLFTCTEEGSFAKCPSQCIEEYYKCSETSDAYIEATTCNYDDIFDPVTGRCTDMSYCSI